MSHPPRRRVVQASELSLFGFCPQAWWLGAVRGLPSAHREALAQGMAWHREHARGLRRAVRLQWAAWALLALGVVLLLARVLLGGGG